MLHIKTSYASHCSYTNDCAFSSLNSTERARLEAQIKAADMALRLKAEAEKKQQRDREREASRMAVQKVRWRLLSLILYSIPFNRRSKYPLPVASVF